MAESVWASSARNLAMQIRSGDRTPTEVVESYLERIEEVNPTLNAFVTVCYDHALRVAKNREEELASGNVRGPLHGVPIAIKDYTVTKGIRTTFGSKLFKNHIPERDAAVVARLRAAGAVIVGKTSVPEYGKGVTENELVGATGTPFDPTRTAGGTSGGSAAAVAAGLVPFAHGNDGSGSIRIPAAFCGVFGFKPSFRRIPRDGRPNGFTGHSPFSHEGPITRTVADAALMMDVMAGPHNRDPFVLPETGDCYLESVEEVKELDIKAAYSPTLSLFSVDDRVAKSVENAADAFARTGASVETIELEYDSTPKEIEDSHELAYTVRTTASAIGTQETLGIDLFDEHSDHISERYRQTLERGKNASAMEYKRTEIARTDLFDTFQDVFDEYDILLTPTTAVPPFEHAPGLLGPTDIDGTPINPFNGWFLTYPFNMTGHPAASVPVAPTPEGLPVGMQIIGPRHADSTVLAASAAFEQICPWEQRLPDMISHPK